MNLILGISIDWDTMFIPSLSLLEIILRGTLTYWFCFAYIRLFRRGAGQLGISDLLLITLIADAAQNSMAGEYKSISEGIVLVGTLVGWDYLINLLGYHTLLFKKVAEPDPILLVKNGVMQRHNMKREFVSEDELMGLLREQGVDTLTDVKTCCIEGSGSISVVQKK